MMDLSSRIKAAIRDVPDYPKPGILFKDITPILATPSLVAEIVEAFAADLERVGCDAVAAVEARGFIFGSMLAHRLGCPFVPVRKAGKLPYRTRSAEYALEYGTSKVEMHLDAIVPGWKVVVHDDLLATGGTASAAAQLVHEAGGVVAGFSFLVNLSFLPGEELLREKWDVRPNYLVSY